MQNVSSPEQSAAVSSQDLILDWLDEVREASKSAPYAELLDFDGIDALDLLLSPIYLSALNALRAGSAQMELGRITLFKRARNWAYRWKMVSRERYAGWQSAPARQADALLWSRDISHTIILHPIAREFARQRITACMLACQANVFPLLRSGNPDPVFSVGAWPAIVRQARREAALRVRHLSGYRNWALPPLPSGPNPSVEAAVRTAVLRYLPSACEAVANAHAAIERIRPKILVVGNDLTLEGRAGCRVAAARGVPSAMFMHGSIAGDVLQRRHCADRVLVFGAVHRQELIQQGVAPERIVVTGAPNLDDRPRQSGQVDPRLEARLGIRPGGDWVLVATSGPGHRISYQHHTQVIENLTRLSAAFPTMPIVVKLHRKDRLEYYRKGLKNCTSSNLIVVAEPSPGFPRNIFEWLQGCRIVLTGASAVAVEAMLMDVPVVTMDFCNEIHGVDFIEAGATDHVTTPAALESVVREILTSGSARAETLPRVQAYLKSAFYALDGGSSRRGVEALCDAMNARGTH